jgi:hypothetical protein
MAKPVDHATEGWVHCGRIDKAAEAKHDGGLLFSINVASCGAVRSNALKLE